MDPTVNKSSYTGVGLGFFFCMLLLVIKEELQNKSSSLLSNILSQFHSAHDSADDLPALHRDAPSVEALVISKPPPTTNQCLLLRSACVTSPKQQRVCEQKTSYCDREHFFHSEAKGRRLKSLSSSLQKIGLLSEEIVTKTD